jgi:hypothetical protein
LRKILKCRRAMLGVLEREVQPKLDAPAHAVTASGQPDKARKPSECGVRVSLVTRVPSNGRKRPDRRDRCWLMRAIWSQAAQAAKAVSLALSEPALYGLKSVEGAL